jgi:hypothetical protein
MYEITGITKNSIKITLLVETIDDVIKETRNMHKFDTKLVDIKLKKK